MEQNKEMAAKTLDLTIEETSTSLRFLTASGVEINSAEADKNIAECQLALDEMANAPVGVASGAQWYYFKHLKAWTEVKSHLTRVTDA